MKEFFWWGGGIIFAHCSVKKPLLDTCKNRKMIFNIILMGVLFDSVKNRSPTFTELLDVVTF